GVRIQLPTRSPNDQVSQTTRNWPQAASPDSVSVVTPIVELTKAAAIVIKANLKIVCAVWKTRGPSANFSMSHAPNTASSVLPAEITSAVASAPVVVMLTMKAPRKTAGQRSIPHKTSAASAMPAGGQTADALALIKAS